MATVTVTPDDPQVGEAILITGSDFLPATVCTVGVTELGVESEITSDAAGAFGTDDVADHAVATLTSDATNVTAADTVTIGAVTYTFRASVTTTANEVKIGATAAITLANLKKAINLSGTGGTEYGSATVIHPTVTAHTLTATTLLLYAKTGGTGGNSLASTEASTHLSFGGATFSGGSATTGVSAVVYHITEPGTYTVTATDGTSSADTTVRIWTQ